jgi:hypothetical protein
VASAAASLFGRSSSSSSSGGSFSRQLREVDAVTAADAANLATVVTSATAVTSASGGNQLSAAADLARPSWCTKAEGKVSRVDCWVNSAGIITGVQLTDDMGIPLPGMCDTRGLPVAGGLLAETESIVEIKACK